MLPGFASTCPRSTSSLFVPRSSTPTLSPACPSSRSFLNISTPVQIVFTVGFNPMISTSSFTFTTPRSILPATQPFRPRANHDRRLVPGKLVHRQKLPNLHLHKLEQLLVVHHVRFVHVYDDVRHAQPPRDGNEPATLPHRR